jgi:hypothetical protein
MITNIPTPTDYYTSGKELLNYAWDTTANLLIEFDQAGYYELRRSRNIGRVLGGHDVLSTCFHLSEAQARRHSSTVESVEALDMPASVLDSGRRGKQRCISRWLIFSDA